MTAETWICSKCGEVLEEQFDTCWNCQTSRDDFAGEIAPDFDLKGESVASETKLDRILKLQQKQSEALDEIRSRVGCLYIYMIVGILLGLIAALLSMAN